MQRICEGGKQSEAVVKVTLSNSAQSLSDLSVTIAKAAGVAGATQKAWYAVIYVDTNDLRMSIGGTPTHALGLLWRVGDTWKLDSEDEIINAEFVNAVAGANSDMHVLIQY